MSTSHPTVTTDPFDSRLAPSTVTVLPRLYFARFGFALSWAVLLGIAGGSINPASVALLILYPLVDVAAAVVDQRSSAGRSAPLLRLNIALSLATAIGVALATASGVPNVLRVWGAWAVAAGVVQLVVAVVRHGLAGQWPMILSGGISAFAGLSFVVMAGGTGPTLRPLAGYAFLGGVFFLVSAHRLRHAAPRSQ